MAAPRHHSDARGYAAGALSGLTSGCSRRAGDAVARTLVTTRIAAQMSRALVWLAADPYWNYAPLLALTPSTTQSRKLNH
jgi:hypothetical protein